MVLVVEGVVAAVDIAGHGVPDGEGRGACQEDMRRECGHGAAAWLEDACPREVAGIDIVADGEGVVDMCAGDGAGALVSHAEGDGLRQRVVDEIVARRDYLRDGDIGGGRLLVDEEEEVDNVAFLAKETSRNDILQR